MITIYKFEKIDNNNNVKYICGYTQNAFQFQEYPYFTTIVTTYNNGAYSDAYKFNDETHTTVTMWDIYDMLNGGTKVDLIVQGKETGTLILPLASIDANYAYFSNNELTLTVDANGAVTEFQPTP